MKKLTFFLFIFLVALVIQAQETPSPASKQDKVNELIGKASQLHRQAEQTGDRKLDEQAEALFKQVIELNPNSYEAYVQLGWIYNHWKSGNYYDPGFLDSAFYFANKALSINNKHSGVYRLIMNLNSKKGRYDKAKEAYFSALKYENFDSTCTTYNNGSPVFFNTGEYAKAIECDLKHNQLMKTFNRPVFTNTATFFRLSRAGFSPESTACNNKILASNKDTAGYMIRMMFDQFVTGKFNDMISTGLEQIKKYPNNLTIKYYLGWGYLFVRNYDEAYNWFNKAFDQVKATGQTPDPNEGYGFVCLQKGMKEEAGIHLTRPVSDYEKIATFNYYPELNLPFLGLAWIYAVKGDKEKAMENLRKNKSFHIQSITMLKYNPMLDNIRNEPEFAKILKNMEEKLKNEREEITKLLKETGGIN